VTPPHPTAPRDARIATLDGFRGCAVLLILVHHFLHQGSLLDAPPGEFASYVRAALGLTWSGVDLFFVLSGFLIGGILLDHRNSPRLLGAFYARRFLRIMPVAWLCVGTALIYHHTTGNGGAPPIPWWVALTFTTNFFMAHAGEWVLSPLTGQWSLAIEEQFYLLFPLVLRAWPTRCLVWLGPILIICSLLARTLIYTYSPENQFACAFWPFCRLDSLGAGFAAAWLVRSPNWPAVQADRRRLWCALGLFSLMLVVLTKVQYRNPAMMTTWGYTALALFYAILLLLIYQPRERWLAAFFSAPWLRLYGKYSYFIYLFQGLLARPIVSLLFHGRWEDAPISSWPEGIAAVIVMLAPAALSWHCFEAPLLRFSKRWSYA
jgi:peptidoglycan/LPS O-acetylase OafA/YrhL